MCVRENSPHSQYAGRWELVRCSHFGNLFNRWSLYLGLTQVVSRSGSVFLGLVIVYSLVKVLNSSSYLFGLIMFHERKRQLLPITDSVSSVIQFPLLSLSILTCKTFYSYIINPRNDLTEYQSKLMVLHKESFLGGLEILIKHPTMRIHWRGIWSNRRLPQASLFTLALTKPPLFRGSEVFRVNSNISLIHTRPAITHRLQPNNMSSLLRVQEHFSTSSRLWGLNLEATGGTGSIGSCGPTSILMLSSSNL